MDCTLRRNATRKHTRIAKNLADSAGAPVAPTTSGAPGRRPPLLLLLLEAAVAPPPPLDMRTAIRELRVMAVDASSVDAMMLLRIVCTASTACFPDGSCECSHKQITARINKTLAISAPIYHFLACTFGFCSSG